MRELLAGIVDKFLVYAEFEVANSSVEEDSVEEAESNHTIDDVDELGENRVYLVAFREDDERLGQCWNRNVFFG